MSLREWSDRGASRRERRCIYREATVLGLLMVIAFVAGFFL